MPLSVPRILIIDDKERDGIKIAKAIWNSKYAARFIKYDPELLIPGGNECLKGVRLIFMDIDLIGDQIPGTGSKTFSAVQKALEYCLDERNGPYILITWSTFDAHADALFQYLNKRMSVALRPTLCKRLNKEDYKRATQGDRKLVEKIKGYMQELEAIGCLIIWEKCIQYSACETLCELIEVALSLGIKDKKDALRAVLYSLARAEGEQNLDNKNSVMHLYSVLSQILYDNLADIRPEEEAALNELVYSGKDLKPAEPWSQKINTMLHLDSTESELHAGHTPGDVFFYPAKGHGLPIPEEATGKFLRGNFMSLTTEDSKAYKARIEKTCKLVLVEITPPCDYAQRKIVWHRYVVGALVPQALVHLTSVLNREKKEREHRLPDFRWESPEFQIKEDPPFRIIFNARLLVSIKSEFQEKVGKRLFRIRQPLLGDMIGWLSRQSSRQGHVSVT